MVPLVMFNCWLLAAVPAQASANGQTESAVSARKATYQLRRQVALALRREATTIGDAHRQAVVDLVTLYHQITGKGFLTRAERQRLQLKIRSRLTRVAKKLDRAAQPGEWKPPQRRPEFLAQQFPPLGPVVAPRRQQRPQAGGAADDAGPELVELIETVIAPNSWEASGGPGSIYYWPNLRVIVVRQTDEVHGQTGDVLEQLRRAGN